jgi:hypothetical protein
MSDQDRPRRIQALPLTPEEAYEIDIQVALALITDSWRQEPSVNFSESQLFQDSIDPEQQEVPEVLSKVIFLIYNVVTFPASL